MANEGLFGFLFDLLIKVQAFVLRPSVQIQLVAILAILLGIGFVSSLVMVAIGRRQKAALASPGAEEENETADTVQTSISENQLIQRMLSTGITLLVFPLLALITTNIVVFILQALNQSAGLLRQLGFILLVLFTYRLFLLLLYVSFPKEKVRRFQARLFSPLFALFVLYQVMQLFGNVNALGTVALFANLLENPITLGGLFFATVGLYFWIDSVSGLNEVIFATATRFTSVNPGRLEASLTLGGYILIMVGIVLSLSLLGVSSTTFAAILGGLSVGIGFGMKEVLSNFMSGILLLFEGSIKPGDSIQFRGQRAIVKKMGIRATYVETLDNIEIIVPNQELLISPVISHTATDTIIRVRVPVQGSYEHAPEKIIKILEQTVKQNSKVLQDRKNKAIVKGFGHDRIDYELRAWIDVTKIGPAGIKNQLYRAISKAFAEHNIELPYPQQEINVNYLGTSEK